MSPWAVCVSVCGAEKDDSGGDDDDNDVDDAMMTLMIMYTYLGTETAWSIQKSNSVCL